MLPYVAYKYVKNKREATKREMDSTLESLTSNLSRSMIPDQVVLHISGVATKASDDSNDYIPGVLSVVEKEIWDKFKMADGTVDQQNIHHLKMNVFRGGLDPDLRKEAWKYLLGYRAWDETNSQFDKKRAKLAKEYERLKAQWLSISEDQESRFFSYSQRKGLVEKDVARTDRSMEFFSGDENPNLVMLHNILMTYVMYNFDLAYVQGMSDFASPLLYVMGNEVDAFWCFVELMKKIRFVTRFNEGVEASKKSKKSGQGSMRVGHA
nr:RabGAP TBC domain containing protein [Haemonchus contortus]